MVRWVSSRDGYSKVGRAGGSRRVSFSSMGKSAAAVTTMWVRSVTSAHEKLQVAQGTHQKLQVAQGTHHLCDMKTGSCGPY